MLCGMYQNIEPANLTWILELLLTLLIIQGV